MRLCQALLPYTPIDRRCDMRLCQVLLPYTPTTSGGTCACFKQYMPHTLIYTSGASCACFKRCFHILPQPPVRHKRVSSVTSLYFCWDYCYIISCRLAFCRRNWLNGMVYMLIMLLRNFLGWSCKWWLKSISFSAWLTSSCKCWLKSISFSAWLTSSCKCWLKSISFSAWLTSSCKWWLKSISFSTLFTSSCKWWLKSISFCARRSQSHLNWRRFRHICFLQSLDKHVPDTHLKFSGT